MKNIILRAFILVFVGMLLCSCGASGEESVWDSGITADIPEFSGAADSVETAIDGSYRSAYYTNVTTEQVNEYINLLETQCGIEFVGEKYPRSAIFGEKIIAIHYNVTEMRFSVTVTEKSQVKTNGEES